MESAWKWPSSCIIKYSNIACSDSNTFIDIRDRFPVWDDWNLKTLNTKTDSETKHFQGLQSKRRRWKLCLANVDRVQQAIRRSSSAFKVRNAHVFHQDVVHSSGLLLRGVREIWVCDLVTVGQKVNTSMCPSLMTASFRPLDMTFCRGSLLQPFDVPVEVVYWILVTW